MAFNEEAFRYIEAMGVEGITAKMLSDKLGLKLQTCHTWLSRWTKKGYLKHVSFEGHVPYTTKRAWQGGRPKGSAGRYMIGDKWWGHIRLGEQPEDT